MLLFRGVVCTYVCVCTWHSCNTDSLSTTSMCRQCYYGFQARPIKWFTVECDSHVIYKALDTIQYSTVDYCTVLYCISVLSSQHKIKKMQSTSQNSSGCGVWCRIHLCNLTELYGCHTRVRLRVNVSPPVWWALLRSMYELIGLFNFIAITPHWWVIISPERSWFLIMSWGIKLSCLGGAFVNFNGPNGTFLNLNLIYSGV